MTRTWRPLPALVLCLGLASCGDEPPPAAAKTDAPSPRAVPARSEGPAPATVPVAVAAAPKGRCRLTVRVTRDGAPAEARVTLHENSWHRRQTGRIWFADDLAEPQMPTEAVRATDEPLRYVAEGLAPERYTVGAVAADGSTASEASVAFSADGESSAVELPLARASARSVLRGRVKGRDGAPFRGLVAASRRSTGSWAAFDDAAWRRVSEDGSFALEIPDGSGVVAVGALVPGRLRAIGPDVTVPTDAPYELDLSKELLPLRVHVVDEVTGRPVAGASAGVHSGDLGTESLEKTDAEGRCTLLMSRGKRTLYVVAAGYPEVHELELAETESEIELPLRAGSSARVRVIRADDGSPVTGVPVYVRDYGPGGVWGSDAPTPSGADGVALVTGLRPGEVFVFALGAGWFSEGLELGRVVGESFSVNNRHPSRPPDLVPESGALEAELRVFSARAVEGVVRGPDGTPVAGAVVKAWATTMLPYVGDLEAATGYEFPVKPVVSGADGRFRLEGLFPSARYGVSATAEGQAGTATSNVDANSPGPVELTFAMPHFVDAEVLDAATGGRLAGATVSLRVPRKADEWAGRVPERAARTSADGSARIGPVVAGEFEATARARGYLAGAAVPVRLDDATPDGPRIRFRLAPGETIRGHVVLEDGTVFEDASVGVEGQPGSQDEESGFVTPGRNGSGTLPCAVAPDGSFEIVGLTSGEHTVQAQARSGKRSFSGSMRARTDGTDVEIRLTAVEEQDPFERHEAEQPSFAVRVLGTDGRPVGRAGIYVTWTTDAMTQSTTFEVERGAARIPVAAKGTKVTVSGAKSLNGIPLDAATQTVEIPRDAADGFEIRLAPGEVLAGKVIDQAGNAVQGVRVGVRMPSDPDDRFDPFHDRPENVLGSTTSRPDGSFEIRRLSSEEYEVTCETPSDFETPAVVRARGGTRDLSLKIVRGVRSVVTVLDDLGNPVAGASVGVSSEGGMFGDELSSAETGPDGRVTLAALASGKRYRLSVSTYGRRLGQWSEEWKPEAQTTVRLERLATISGRVFAADGEPAGGVAVWYSEQSDTKEAERRRGWTRVTADADGRFAIEGLGAVEVHLVAGGYAWINSGFNGMFQSVEDSELVASAARKVAAGATDVELRLVAAHLVRVKLVGLKSPLAQDEFPILQPAERGAPLTPIATKDADVLLFSGVTPEREFELRARIPRQGLIGKLSGVRAGIDASLALEPGTALEGRLVAPEGERVEGAFVDFVGGGFDVRENAGADGRFVIPCLPRVEGEVRAWSYGRTALGGGAKATPGTPVEIALTKSR